MSRVTMTHPSLPGQPIEVDEVSVPHHRAAGWQVEEPPQETPPAAPKHRRQTRKEVQS
jgi:hypothetical protein